jgi:hypothetical protein
MPIVLDLDLALTRVADDHASGRSFVTRPYEMALIASRRAEWLAGINDQLARDFYTPSPAIVVNVPKGDGAVRPGAVLALVDQVVYAAAVGAVLLHVRKAIQWCNPPKDYSYLIRNPSSADWLVLPYRCWDSFRKRSLELLAAGPAVVVSTDVTGFYEHVDHEVLHSVLRDAGVPDDLNALITRCLGRWCVLNKRGLPQNNTASHILAKLYLTPVDHALSELRFEHVRYVDDTRIFCANRGEAKRALLQLSVLLRERGLTLQSAKTEVLLPGAARTKFEGVVPVIAPLAKHYIEEIAGQVGRDPRYMTVTEAERLVMQGTAEIPAEMLQSAYEAHFLRPPARFERSLFHFLVLRLGRARDAFAVDHCLLLLDQHPEETDYILSYLANVGAVLSSEPSLLRYLQSVDSVYDYQVYQIVRWRTRIPSPPTDEFLRYVRGLVAAPNTPPHLLAACRAFVGRFGSPADLDGLLRDYATAPSDHERAEIVCAVARLEAGRRNAFLGRARDDGFLTEAAVRGTRAGRDWAPA